MHEQNMSTEQIKITMFHSPFNPQKMDSPTVYRFDWICLLGFGRQLPHGNNLCGKSKGKNKRKRAKKVTMIFIETKIIHSFIQIETYKQSFLINLYDKNGDGGKKPQINDLHKNKVI